MRLILALFLIATAAVAQPRHPKLHKLPNGAKGIADRYTVIFRDDATPRKGDAAKLTAGLRKAHKGVTADGLFELSFRGFCGRIPPGRLQALLNDPRVESIEPDQEISIEQTASSQRIDWGADYIGADSSTARSGNGSGSVVGVDVYVLDTGIDPTHPDLNVVGGYNYGYQLQDSTHWEDGHGHGTHVAGIIGARDNGMWTVGVAPGVRLWSVRVFGPLGYGASTNTFKGVEWVRRQRLAKPYGPMVVNMSLVCGRSLSMDRAVKALILSGVTVVAAAGNNRTDASNYSPGRLPEAITVAASDRYGRLASFSNYGSVVDIIAPGVGIISSRWQGGVTSKSGTSMSTPHVSGAVALYLSAHPTATAVQVSAALIGASRPWLIGLIPTGTPNRLLRVNSF